MSGHKITKTYAFIDGNNLYLGAKSQNIELDYRKLRLYLTHKFGVKKAFIFIGYDPDRGYLYNMLVNAGFILIHKPTVVYVENGKRTMKGNVDAELVLYSAAIEYSNYDKAIVITSDGDFTCLFSFLTEREKLSKIITPTRFYSSLFQPLSSYILPLYEIAPMVKKDK